MAVQIGATTCCLTVQQSLDAIAQGNVTSLKITNHGALQALTSPSNTSGFEALANNDPNGKDRVVRVKYWTNPRTAASTSAPNICSTDTTTAEKYANVTIDQSRSVKLTLSEPEFRTFCDPGVRGSAFAQQQIQGKLNQLFDGLDTDIVTYLSTHRSNFYGGVAPGKTVKLVKSDESPSQGGIIQVEQDMMEAGTVGMPFAIGSGYVWSVGKLLNLACCSTAGIDLSKLAGSPWVNYYDLKVDSIMDGQNNALIVAPGAAQIVPKLKWVGEYDDLQNGTAREDQVKTNISVPVPGGGSLPVDFTVYRSFCGSNNDGDTSWILTWTVPFGMWSLPSDVEAVGSPYRSVNYIFHYQFTCGAAACADVAS